MPYSKHAFNCAKCPGKGGEGGCPAWWETVHENIQTGEVKTERGCAYEQLPLYLIEVIKACNRPAASVDAVRQEIVTGFSRLLALGPLPAQVKTLPSDPQPNAPLQDLSNPPVQE